MAYQHLQLYYLTHNWEDQGDSYLSLRCLAESKRNCATGVANSLSRIPRPRALTITPWGHHQRILDHKTVIISSHSTQSWKLRLSFFLLLFMLRGGLLNNRQGRLEVIRYSTMREDDIECDSVKESVSNRVTWAIDIVLIHQIHECSNQYLKRHTHTHTHTHAHTHSLSLSFLSLSLSLSIYIYIYIYPSRLGCRIHR